MLSRSGPQTIVHDSLLEQCPSFIVWMRACGFGIICSIRHRWAPLAGAPGSGLELVECDVCMISILIIYDKIVRMYSSISTHGKAEQPSNCGYQCTGESSMWLRYQCCEGYNKIMFYGGGAFAAWCSAQSDRFLLSWLGRPTFLFGKKLIDWIRMFVVANVAIFVVMFIIVVLLLSSCRPLTIVSSWSSLLVHCSRSPLFSSLSPLVVSVISSSSHRSIILSLLHLVVVLSSRSRLISYHVFVYICMFNKSYLFINWAYWLPCMPISSQMELKMHFYFSFDKEKEK